MGPSFNNIKAYIYDLGIKQRDLMINLASAESQELQVKHYLIIF